MPLSSTQRKFGPTPGNGVAKDFPFTCKVFEATDMQVIRTSANGGDTYLVFGTDYSVSLNQDQEAQPGGTVSMVVAPATGQFVTLMSAVPNLQPTDWQNQGGFAPDTMDDSLDRGVAQTQQLAEQMGRTLKVPSTVDPVSMAKPQGGGLLAWNADGTQVINIDPAQVAGFAAYSSSELSVFTGDGVETVFPLGVDGGSLANLRVSIAGVAQTPGVDFTWPGGALIEFAEPPADGLTIVVQYFAVMASSTELNEAIEAVLAALSSKANVNLDNVPLNVLSAEWRAALPGTPDGLLITPDGGPAARPASELFGRGDNTPKLGFAGTTILINGTSIEHQNANAGDSIFDLVRPKLDIAKVIVNAWAGSHAYFLPLEAYALLTTREEKLNFISALGMTDADVAAGIAMYGPTSAFHDDFDPVTKASQQTVEYRVGKAFEDYIIGLWADLHGHNDRARPHGTLSPPSSTVTGITLGATTVLTVANIPAGLTVGQGLGIRLVGIPKLAFGAGRVQAINTGAKTITIALNSTGFAGTLTGGVAEFLDRSTLWGAQEFILHYGFGKALQNQGFTPVMQWSSPPSEYTGGTYQADIYTVARATQLLAAKRHQSMFDLLSALKVSEDGNEVLLGDLVHPTEFAQREAIANQWVKFWSFGAVSQVNQTEWVKRGQGGYLEGRPLEYSSWLGGIGTPSFTVTGATSIFTEDFVSIADWTVFGSPSVVDAPWPGGGKALRCASVAGSSPFIVKFGLSPVDAISVAYDFAIAQTVGIVPDGSVGITTLGKIETPTGAWLTMTAVSVATGSWLQIGHYNADGSLVDSYVVRSAEDKPITGAAKYRLRVDAVKSTVDREGALLAYLTPPGGSEALLFSTAIPLDDVAVPKATVVTLGISFTNVAAVTVHFGNLTYSELLVSPTLGKTGSVTISGTTLTYVNGRLISVSP